MKTVNDLNQFLEENSFITDDRQALEEFEKRAREFSADELPDADETEFEEKPITVDEATKEEGEEYDVFYNVFVDNSASTWDYAKKVTVIKPHSLNGTSKAVQFAETKNMKLRGLGSRHSFSLAPSTDHCYIDLEKTVPYDPGRHNETIKKLDQSALELLRDGIDKKQYFDALCGLNIESINNILCPEDERLDSLHGMQRSMYNMGGGDVQTFAGAFSTGTHGSGGIYSAYHDTIRSIVLVASNGNVYRIEPHNGITDRQKYEQYYAQHPDLLKPQLIQNNDHFYSTLVSMGCFGIIYSVIIEVQEMKLLHEESFYRESGWTAKFKKTFKKSILPSPSSGELFYYVQLNPYKLRKNRFQSILEKRIVPTKIPGQGKKVRNRKFWPTAFANSGFAVSIIRHIANAGLMPKRRLIERALRTQNDHDNDGGGFTDMTYKVWNAGSGKLKSFGTAIEFAFPVDRIPEVLDLLFAFLEQTGDRGVGYYLNAPVALRFVRAGKAYLAPNYEYTPGGKKIKEWCYIEILRVNSKNAEDDKREMELFQHIQRMFTSMGGRPHWGLNFNFEFSKTYLQSIYPKFNKWLSAYHKFNSTGVFENALTRKMEISPAMTTPLVS